MSNVLSPLEDLPLQYKGQQAADDSFASWEGLGGQREPSPNRLPPADYVPAQSGENLPMEITAREAGKR